MTYFSYKYFFSIRMGLSWEILLPSELALLNFQFSNQTQLNTKAFLKVKD